MGGQLVAITLEINPKPYLGGLDPVLHTPRRAMPRAHTPAGSVNIGGQQTAIASVPGNNCHTLSREIGDAKYATDSTTTAAT